MGCVMPARAAKSGRERSPIERLPAMPNWQRTLLARFRETGRVKANLLARSVLGGGVIWIGAKSRAAVKANLLASPGFGRVAERQGRLAPLARFRERGRG